MKLLQAIIMIGLISFSLSSLARSKMTVGTRYCMIMDTYEYPDSEGDARSEWEGIEYVEVNGTGVPFETVKGSVRYDSRDRDSAIGVKEKGCFDLRALNVGANNFYFEVTNLEYDDEDTYIHSKSVVVLDFGKDVEPKELFNVERKGKGEKQHFKGNKTIRLSLKEIDPGLIRAMEFSKERINEFIAQEGPLSDELNRSVEEVERRLDAVLEKSLDDISPDELDDIIKEYHKISELITDLKKEIEVLRQEAKESVAKLKIELEKMKDPTEEQLRSAGIKPGDDSPYVSEMEKLELPLIEIPSISEEQPAFDSDDDPYAEYADGLIERLQAAWDSGNRLQFLQLVDSWEKFQSVFLPTLEARAGVSVGEYEAYARSQNRILLFIRRYLDEKSFFKESPLKNGSDVKNAVHRELIPAVPELGKKLRNALNLWHGQVLSEPQKLLADTIVLIGAGFGDLATGARDPDGVVRNRLTALTQEAVRLAYVSQKWEGSDPNENFVLCCEMATGRRGCEVDGEELSIPQRLFSSTLLTEDRIGAWATFGKYFASLPPAERIKIQSSKELQQELMKRLLLN